ncbi:hypothetical protein EOM82_06210, partial [bacterium]|nr:hypothetical protein [bacterium]
MIAEYITSIITLVTVFTLLYFYRKKSKHHKLQGKDSAYAGVWWVSIFICGLALYFIAEIKAQKPVSQTMLSFVLFAISSSFSKAISLFGFDLDYESIGAIASLNNLGSYLYCIAIILCYVAASLWTVVMAKNIFLKGISNSFNIFLHRNKGWHRKIFKKASMETHYIVIGCEKKARVFLTNLSNSVKRANITVVTGITKDNRERELCKELIELGYTTILGKFDQNIQKTGIDNDKCKIIVVAMSESDQQNLTVAEYVTELIKKKVNPKKVNGRILELDAEQKSILQNINLSAYIAYTYIERAEHFSFAEYSLGRVHFFNPYEVRARMFFREYPLTKLIPFEWINTEKARLKNASERLDNIKAPYKISNIFVGFGKTNRQMLKKSICNNQMLGIDYNALVIDKDTDIARKQLINEAPGLFDMVNEKGEIVSYGSELLPNSDRNIYYKSQKERNNVNFLEFDAVATDFYNAIKEEVSRNDFSQVVISLGDDKLNIETALELRQKLYETKLLTAKCGVSEYNRVKIFVKIKERSIFTQDSII